MSVIIRLQNLPWSANAADIRRFFHGLSIPDGGVHIVGGENGDAFIAFSTDEDARKAMMLNPGIICNVQVKLFLSSKSEMQTVIAAARGAPAAAPAAAPAPAAPATVVPSPMAPPALPPMFQSTVQASSGGWSAAATAVTPSQPPYTAASRYTEEPKFSSTMISQDRAPDLYGRLPTRDSLKSPYSSLAPSSQGSDIAPTYGALPPKSSAPTFPAFPELGSINLTKPPPSMKTPLLGLPTKPENPPLLSSQFGPPATKKPLLRDENEAVMGYEGTYKAPVSEVHDYGHGEGVQHVPERSALPHGAPLVRGRGRGLPPAGRGLESKDLDRPSWQRPPPMRPPPSTAHEDDGYSEGAHGQFPSRAQAYPPVSRESPQYARGRGSRFTTSIPSSVKDTQGNEFAPMPGSRTEEMYQEEQEFEQHYPPPERQSRPPPQTFRGRGVRGRGGLPEIGLQKRGGISEIGARELGGAHEFDTGGRKVGSSHEVGQDYGEWGDAQPPKQLPHSTGSQQGPFRGGPPRGPPRGRPLNRGGRGRGDFPRSTPPGEYERQFSPMEIEERDQGRNSLERGHFGPPMPGDQGKSSSERGRFGHPGPGRGRGRGGFDQLPPAGASLLGDPPARVQKIGDREPPLASRPDNSNKVPSLFDNTAFPKQDKFEPPARSRFSGGFDNTDFDRDGREMSNMPDKRAMGSDFSSRGDPSISPVPDSPNRSFESRRGNRSMDRSFENDDRNARDFRREDDRRRIGDSRGDSRPMRGMDRRQPDRSREHSREHSRDRSPVRSRDIRDSRKDDKRDDRRGRPDDRRDPKSSRDRTRDDRRDSARRDDRHRDSRDRDSRSKTDLKKDSRDDGKSKPIEKTAIGKDSDKTGSSKALRDEKQDDKGVSVRHTSPPKPSAKKEDSKRKLESHEPETCVSVKGLPQSVTFRDVRKFFAGCDIKWNGLKLINNDEGKRTGNAFVQFESEDMAKNAVKRSGNKMNNNVITVVKCSLAEFDKAVDSYIPGSKQPAAADSSKRPKIETTGGTNICVKNLPSDVEERDILEFFKPLKVKSVFLNYDRNGGVMDSGYVEFEVPGDGTKATKYNGKDLRGKKLVIESIEPSEQPEITVPPKAATETRQNTTVPQVVQKPGQPVDNRIKPQQAPENRVKPQQQTPDNTPKPRSLQPSPTVKKPDPPSPGFGQKPAFVAKLEGVPYEAQLHDLVRFCDGLKILPGGIHLFYEADGRAYQNAYVELATSRDLEYATRRTGRRLGRRFVTVKSVDKETLDQELMSFGGISTGTHVEDSTRPGPNIGRDSTHPGPNIGRGIPKETPPKGPVVSIFDLNNDQRGGPQDDPFSRDRKPLLGSGPQDFGPAQRNLGPGLLGAAPPQPDRLHEDRMGGFHEEEMQEEEYPRDEDRRFPPMGHEQRGGPPPDHRRGVFPHRGRGRPGHPRDIGHMADEDHRLDGRGRRPPPLDGFQPRDGDMRRPPFGERGPRPGDKRRLLGGDDWEEEELRGGPRPALLGHKPAAGLLGDAPLDLHRSSEGDKLPLSYQGRLTSTTREPLLHAPGAHGTSSHVDPPDVQSDWFPVAIKNAPSKVTLEDILEFFLPFHPVQDSVKVRYRADGTPTGDVLVAFTDIKEAGRAIRERNMKLLLGKPVPVFKP